MTNRYPILHHHPRARRSRRATREPGQVPTPQSLSELLQEKGSDTDDRQDRVGREMLTIERYSLEGPYLRTSSRPSLAR